MHRYRPARIPPGAHTRPFSLLSKPEQRESVKRLLRSGLSRTAIGQLTGLSLPDIAALLAT